MLQYHADNTLVVSYRGLASQGLVTEALWKKWVRGGAELVQRGGNGRESLMKYDTIPVKHQERIKQQVGTPTNPHAISTSFKQRINPDPAAIEFFSNYNLPDGRILGTVDEGKYLREYTANTNVLNLLQELHGKQRAAKKKLAKRFSEAKFFDTYSPLVNACDTGHTLPTTPTTLRRKYNQYTKGYTNKAGIFKKGYEALISDKFCNDNSRKVSDDIEKLIMALYAMPNKPFSSDVHQMYLAFLEGVIEVFDKTTGEVFRPEDFKRNGKPLEVSRSTIWSYINNPDNRSTVDIKRNGQFQFNSMHRPHHHRNLPFYSFSKISMDDRDLPRKLHSGARVKAYYAYDVLSGAVIGASYSVTKDEELFLDCMRDVFRNIEREGLRMPLEVEVENHLVSKFKDELEFMFQYVRWCNAGNSQEKHAEHYNNSKKYTVEKKLQTGVGRWWAKSEAKRVDQAKIDDQFVEKSYDFDRLVADDLAAIKVYNNQAHPKKKTHPDKTRWQVLIQNINPDATQPNKAVVYRSIGYHTQTTIRRNQYVRVQYADYNLPHPEIMRRLAPNNYEVDAYYLPDADGVISEVYIYQNGSYICTCKQIGKYNTAKAEWTDADAVAYTKQAKYVSEFDARKKSAKLSLPRIGIQEREEIRHTPVKIVQETVQEEEDYMARYDPQEARRKALENI